MAAGADLREPAVETSPQGASGEGAPADASAAVPEQEPTPPPPAASELVLQIEAVQKTWLKVIADIREPEEYLLEPGDRLELSADSGFNLLIGNATGLRLTLNGENVPVPGKKGQVVNLQLP
jgi:hypothetical protein